MPVRQVAVTGLGLVTPAGIGVACTWDRVCAGIPAADTDPVLDGHPVRISCRVPGFDADELLGGRASRRSDPFVQFAVIAAREALSDAGLDPLTWDGARVGVVLGCADGGPGTVETQHDVLREHGPGRVSPLLLPMQLPNMLAGQMSIEIGATGPSLVVATACASGGTALGLAVDLLRLGRCDVVLAGGSDAMVTPLVMAGFARMGALSRRNDDPKGASRPFDADRDGFVAAEGAGMLVLERAEDARARRARIRALLAGHGESADAHHVTAPDPAGRGLERAIRVALADAGLSPGEVDHVNAHGTSTPANDLTEAQVLRRILGTRPLVTSTKGVTGHLFGAAGAIEAAFTVLSLECGLIPPTANLTNPDPRIHLDLATAPTMARPRTAISTSAGFGGQNAALALVRA
jgi:3-oxoacyl-[acyl-carrier-protein] synthase II